MRRLIPAVGLQMIALALAAYQTYLGVRTDEAKYLLDIPYPHPPLARFLISLSDSWSFHEIFWRIVFATLVIQSVWLILDMLKDAKPVIRIAISVCWLLSAAVVTQAGTVMMAVLTALQMLVFIWLFLRPREPVGQSYLIALFWLASLFTAYQAILFLPLVWAVLGRSRTTMWQRCLLIGIPVLLLALYTFTNPLVPASMLNHAGKDATETLLMHATGMLQLWIIGGSIVLSIVGTIGLLLKPRAGLLLSFGLIAAYIFLSRYDYYAILFTPLLIAGVISFLRRYPVTAVPLIALMPIGLAVTLFLAVPLPQTGVVDAVYESIDAHGTEGDVLITGSFGHEWQYGTMSTVRRLQLSFLDAARAVICIRPCEGMQTQSTWMQLPDVPVEAWVRRP